MSDLSLLVIASFLSVGLGVFVLGFLAGYGVRSCHRYSLRINQNRGEAAVRKAIVSNFPPPQYHLLNNVTISFRDGTTQIDHVLVSTRGIFVIETKDYSGWFFGDAYSKQWKQVLYGTESRFQNPIQQNFLHVKAIQHLFDFLPEEQIRSIVVFTGSGQFKTSIPEGVMYLSQLVEYLENFQDETISVNRVEFCVGRLECKRYAATKLTDLQHQAYLAQKFDRFND